MCLGPAVWGAERLGVDMGCRRLLGDWAGLDAVKQGALEELG